MILDTKHLDFFTTDELDRAWHSMENDAQWKWHLNAGGVPFWIMPVWQKLDWIDNKHTPIWKSNTADIWKELLDKVWQMAGKNFIPWRFILNGQTQGLDGGKHRDWTVNDPTGVTFIAYMNKEWKQQWGGETAFYDDAGKNVLNEFPEPGKIIGYKGTVVHAGKAPVVPRVFRVTLAIQGKYNS